MTKVIHVRDVPEQVHRVLAARAEARGISLSAYLREVLAEEALRPTLDEVLPDIGGHAPQVTAEEIVAALRAERSGR